MPLIDPVTMSTSIAKGAVAQARTTTTSQQTAPAPASSPAPVLHPVQTIQTPFAQTMRLVFQGLVMGSVAAFPALVADPVSAMTKSLPLAAALQVGYAVLCLPPAGSQKQLGAKAGAARKTRPGEGGKRRAGGGGEGGAVVAPNAIATALLALLLSALVTPALHAALVLFGAPFLTHGAHTLLCAAHLAVLALFPLFYVHGVDATAWAAVGGFSAPLDETFGGLVGAVVGAWLGAVPIPLDWDREWQRWPVTIVCGMYGGYWLGRVFGGSAVWGMRF